MCICCSEPNYIERDRHPLPLSLEAAKEDQSLLGEKLHIMSLKLITLSVLKGFKLYKALLWYLQNNLSCWRSPSKAGLMSADICFTPDQCQEILWSHSWYDTKLILEGALIWVGFKSDAEWEKNSKLGISLEYTLLEEVDSCAMSGSRYFSLFT